MQTTQHSTTRCRVYLHPTACTSPKAVEAIQKRIGVLVIIPALRQPELVHTTPAADDFGPFGGDAA